ncbi:MAG TPA: hypothetical protein ENK55_05420 [Actinobacteria bacterium]|nr:hypothetical protein [Actinomycetota bacterium]
MPTEPIEQIVDEVRAIVEDPSYPAARRWLDTHPDGKVLGHFQVYFPEELAHAAGVLPIKVAGFDTALQIRKADAHLAAFVCSIARSALELVMSGTFDLLDMFVFPPICDVARHSCAVWARNFEDIDCQILYLPHNAASPAAVPYLAGEYRRILREIEEVASTRVTDEALRASIQLFNENRRLIRELYRVKRETPWKLAATEAYLLTRAAGVMPREEHNEILRRALAALEEREGRPQDRIKVVFVGGFCEQPPLDLISVVQDACYIVDDDFMVGLRWILEDVPVDGDPIEALADAYLNRSDYSPVQHDPRKPKEEMLLRKIRESGAEAAIIAAAKMCEPGLEEQVGYSQALFAEGIPHLVMEFEEKSTTFEQTRMEVETFAESLLFEFA